MTKDEMKNRISFALKDPILQQGFEIICKNLADLERENRLLGERCNQLLKDKGNLTDELANLKEILAQTIENDEVSYETLRLHDQEEIGMLNSRIAELKQQIEKMKQCGNCGNKTIGNCEYCKRKPSQIFAGALTSDYWRLKEIKRK